MQNFDDAGVTALATVVSDVIENFCHRRFKQEERTEQFNVRRLQKMLSVDAYPIDVSGGPVLELREALDRNFTNSSTVIPASQYYVDSDSGTILLDGCFRGGGGSIRLQWTGGLAATTASLQTQAPDLVEAASMWVAELWDRRDTQTVRAITGRTGRSFVSLSKPPPLVESILTQYRASRLTGV